MIIILAAVSIWKFCQEGNPEAHSRFETASGKEGQWLGDADMLRGKIGALAERGGAGDENSQVPGKMVLLRFLIS